MKESQTFTGYHPLVFKSGVGKYALSASVFSVGDDLQVVIYGGDKPHIGAVALGRLEADGNVEIDVLCVGTHREGVVVEPVARHLVRRLRRTVVVSAGMHWDEIDPAGIAHVVDLSRLLADKIILFFET
jgi:hypothetical protein